jgi:hypothetical protein
LLTVLEFQSMIACPIAFGPVIRQNIMAEDAHFIAPRKQREWNGLGDQYLLQGHVPSDLTSSH